MNYARKLALQAPVLLLVMTGLIFSQRSKTAEAVIQFKAQNFSEASTLLKQVLAEDENNTIARVYLAESLRRLGEYEEALKHARLTLRTHASNSFAMTIIASAYNPRQHQWSGTNADSTWRYLQLAVKKNERDGNAWMSLWTEAVIRKDAVVEKRALRALIETEFFTPAMQEMSRWLLETLPLNAILITGGDMDTYPALAVQEVRRVRQDVCIINLPMLNLKPYAELLNKRYELGLEALIGSPSQGTSDLTSVSARDLIHELVRQDSMYIGRAVTFAATISSERVASISGANFLVSAYYRTGKYALADYVDRIISHFAKLDGKRLVGPPVSSSDRSPVRSALDSDWIKDHVANLALTNARRMDEAGMRDPALRLVRWLRQFADDVELKAERKAQIEKILETLEG